MAQDNNLQLFTAPERRYKILRVTPELIADALLNHVQIDDVVNTIAVEGIPSGCEIESMGFDPMHRRVWIRLYHPSFAEIDEGAMIPVLQVNIKKQSLQVKRTSRGYEFI